MAARSIIGPHVGLVMREGVRRVTEVAPKMRFTEKLRQKGVRLDGRPDWVGPADEEGQRIFEELLTEHFVEPLGFGIIGEEDGLNIPCTVKGHSIYFTVDPIDGTSAFGRQQSTGIGSMVALVADGEVVAVCIGDILAGEMYYFRPGSDKTHRLADGIATPMRIDPARTLRSQHAVLRELPHKYDPVIQKMILGKDPLFADAETANGSIGLSMARMWTGVNGAHVSSSLKNTPWDDTPCIGMNHRLGFDHYDIHLNTVRHFVPAPPTSVVKLGRRTEVMVVHESRRHELVAWCLRNGVNFVID
jgi:fructose-1,6-bisphosphatase/inositol monophosphatase family enzyme